MLHPVQSIPPMASGPLGAPGRSPSARVPSPGADAVRPPPPASPVWVTPKDAADHLGVSVGWLSKLRGVGDGPVFSKFGRRAIRFRLTELDRWAQERERASTSERPEAVA